MRILLLAVLLLQSAAFLAAGKLSPLTVKDVGLMLRSGYSLADTEKEIRARYFTGDIDAAAEKALLDVGATPAFVAVLKSGSYAIPAAEVAAIEQAAAARAQRQAQQVEQAKQLNTLYQHQQEQARAAAAKAPADAMNTPHVIARELRGSLVNGLLTTYTDQPLEKKKLIALYFSASWCGPCRKFTPELVNFYRRVASTRSDFEIVFVSADRSASAMTKYMRDFQMPWPAISFEKIVTHPTILKYGGSGIPSLVVIDAQGKVVSDSYEGSTYRGPARVIADLENIFAESSAPSPVAKR